MGLFLSTDHSTPWPCCSAGYHWSAFGGVSDNNDVEQLMKQVAIGRKNWLFVGSVDAGQRAANFVTLVSSAVRNSLDVWAYVKDVLGRLLAGETDYASMRPDVWRQAHPEAIREYRVAERCDRAARRQYRRAARRRLRSKSPR